MDGEGFHEVHCPLVEMTVEVDKSDCLKEVGLIIFRLIIVLILFSFVIHAMDVTYYK